MQAELLGKDLDSDFSRNGKIKLRCLFPFTVIPKSEMLPRKPQKVSLLPSFTVPLFYN